MYPTMDFPYFRKSALYFFQTISDINLCQLNVFYVKTINHKELKTKLLYAVQCTLAVYPCELDLGLWILWI